ncbi:MAG TPA: hypothetical protein VGO59_01750 [Verrucomicrobiae bacterium]
MGMRLLKDKERENRLMIVPSKSDMANHPDHFKELYQRVFAAVGGTPKEYTMENGELRDLKDLTLISLPCWGLDRDRGIDWLHKTLADLKLNRPSELAYIYSTPTVLVTAEGPSNPGIGMQRAFNWGAIYDSIPLTLHLASDAAFDMVRSDVFSSAPVCVACRSNGGEDFWPLRMNLIQLPRPGSPAPPRVGHCLRQKTGSWDIRFTLIPENQPSRTISKQLLTRQFQKIAQMLTEDTNGILVYGLPGCGLGLLVELLDSESVSAGGRKYKLHKRDWQPDQGISSKDLEQIVKKDPGGRHLFVINATSHRNCREEVDLEAVANLISPGGIRERTPQIFIEGKMKIMHFGYFDQAPTTDHRLKPHEVRTLEDEDLETLEGQYSHRAPLDSRRVRELTGRYAGFTKCVMDGVLARFTNDWEGACLIRETTALNLLSRSLEDPELEDSLRKFVSFHENDPVRRQVFTQIRDALMAQFAGHALRDILQRDRIVDLSACTKDPNWIAMKRWLNHLADYKILKPLPDLKFHVLVVAPFLCRRSATIFLSYPNELAKVKAKVRTALEQWSCNNGATIAFKDYQGPHGLDAPLGKRTLREKFKVNMDGVDDAIFIHSGEKITSPHVRKELKLFRKGASSLSYRRRPAHPIVVFVNTTGRGPKEFWNVDRIILTETNNDGEFAELDNAMEQIAGKIIWRWEWGFWPDREPTKPNQPAPA